MKCCFRFLNGQNNPLSSFKRVFLKTLMMMWKKLPFLIWKMLKNLWSPYFLVWLWKKIKTIFIWPTIWANTKQPVAGRISLNIVLDQEKTKQKYKINTYCVQLYSFWCIRHLGICKPSCIWILLFEYFKWKKKVLKNNEKKMYHNPSHFWNPPIKNTFLLYLSL